MKRCDFGNLVDDLFERGLEIALAGSFVVNGINALDVRADGSPLTPFLSSSLAILSPSPVACAFGMVLMGACYFVLIMIDMRRSLASTRCAVSILSGILYLLIALAVITGAEPRTAAFRYLWNVVLALLCFLGTFRLVLAEHAQRKAGG